MQMNTTAVIEERQSRAQNVGLAIPTVRVGGLPIAIIDRARSAQGMIDVALARRGVGGPPLVVTSANGQVISACARDSSVHSLFCAADLIHADGMPLVFASRLKCAMPLPERVATTDLFHDVARLAERSGARFYLLGGTTEVIEMAARNVNRLYPRLVIAGYRNGYFEAYEEPLVIETINRTRPDVLWVGLGIPAEQAFSLRNRDKLTGVGIIKTSGGLFDFLSGRNRRAPAWMQAAGLEWLYRMALEPRRLMARYLRTNPHAVYLLLTQTERA
jgi:exopolysaccharide biosynthesis WecB/TagA/CpsF family protein